MVFEYSGNVTCGYWNLPKDQHLFSSSHTFLTQKQLFHQEFVKKYYPLTMLPKCSLGCPEHCIDGGTLSDYSRNIVCRLGYHPDFSTITQEPDAQLCMYRIITCVKFSNSFYVLNGSFISQCSPLLSSIFALKLDFNILLYG